MRKLPLYLVSAALALTLAMPAQAQRVQRRRAAADVLQRIPANTVAFVVVPNLGSASSKVDQFIADIGLQDMVPGSVLELAQQATQIAEGLDEQGSLVALALTPSDYGWDLEQMISEEWSPEGPPPVALLIPGGDAEQLFAAYDPQEEDGYLVVEFGGEPMYARAADGYTVLATMPEVVDAVLEPAGNVTDRLGEHHAEILGGADLAVWIDVEALQPAISAIMDKAQEEIEAGRESGRISGDEEAGAALAQSMLDTYREILEQIDGVTMALRLTRDGVVVESYSSFGEDTVMGRLLAAMQPGGEPLLNKLPNLPYVLALGAQVAPEDDDAAQQLAQTREQFLADLMNSEALAAIPQAARDQAEAALNTLGEQITGVQMYAGGSARGAGVFGVSCVMSVRDAGTAMGAIGQLAQAGQTAVTELAGDDEAFAMTYTRAVADVGDVEADGIVITFAEMEQMSPQERQMMGRVLGETRIVFYVVPVDDNTVVVTFGGGPEFLAEAVSAAAEGTPMMDDEAIARALEPLPDNPVAVTVISPQNLLDVIRAGFETLDQEMPPELERIELTTDTPVAAVRAIRGTGAHGALFIPTQLVADGVRFAQQMMGGGYDEDDDYDDAGEDDMEDEDDFDGKSEF